MEYFKHYGITVHSEYRCIKNVYKKLALKYHPDKNKIDTSVIFKEIQEAYNILCKEKEKEQLNTQNDDECNYNGFNILINVSLYDIFINKYIMYENIKINVNSSCKSIIRKIDGKKYIFNFELIYDTNEYTITEGYLDKIIKIDILDLIKCNSIIFKHIDNLTYSLTPQKFSYINVNTPIILNDQNKLRVIIIPLFEKKIPQCIIDLANNY